MVKALYHQQRSWNVENVKVKVQQEMMVMKHFLNGMIVQILSMVLAGGFLVGVDAEAAVNVYLSSSAPSNLQNDFIATTTNQYLGSLSQPFPNTYTLRLTGKNPAYACGQRPCDLDRDIASLVDVSSAIVQQNYVCGFSNGMVYERMTDARAASYYMTLCEDTTHFPLLHIDTTTCHNVLGFLSNWIVSQTSGLPVVPNLR